jgi:hypothetical protein
MSERSTAETGLVGQPTTVGLARCTPSALASHEALGRDI